MSTESDHPTIVLVHGALTDASVWHPAGDLSSERVAVMAAAQHPIEPAALDETFDGPATWRSLPSWTLVCTADRSIPTEAQRFMADRAGSTVVDIEASHAVPLSRPGAAAELIADAARSIARPRYSPSGRRSGAGMIAEDTHLQIGSLLFDGVDQIDLTGPFEVLSRLPNATHRIYARTGASIRDVNGLSLTPDATLADAPRLDVLHVPGGEGQQALMDDDELLHWIRVQAAGARAVLSVCTGALVCGAAGLLVGRRATTHWASLHLLSLFGATAVDARVVTDGNWTFAAGVTAGIDAALRLAAGLRGESAARRIQLDIAYAPEPPFDSGTPATAPPHVLAAARASAAELTARRERTARRIATRLGIPVSEL